MDMMVIFVCFCLVWICIGFEMVLYWLYVIVVRVFMDVKVYIVIIG